MSCGINEDIKNVQFVTCTHHLETKQFVFWTWADGAHSEYLLLRILPINLSVMELSQWNLWSLFCLFFGSELKEEICMLVD